MEETPFYGKKAMWSPQGDYREAKSEAEEDALRKDGWIDGHEYWSKQNSAAQELQPPEPQAVQAAPETPAGKRPAPKKGGKRA